MGLAVYHGTVALQKGTRKPARAREIRHGKPAPDFVSRFHWTGATHRRNAKSGLCRQQFIFPSGIIIGILN